MGKQRRNLWLIGLLVALLVIAYASGTFDAAPTTVDVPTLEVDAADVSAVEIDSPDFTVKAERSAGTWQLTEPVAWLADSSVVSSFVRSVAGMDLQSIVSTNPERYGRYGVDSTGSDVRLSLGSREIHLVVSSEGPDFSTNYVRLGDDERIFVGSPRLALPTDANRWRSRIVARIPEPSIQTVSVSSPGEDYSIERADGGWQFHTSTGSTPADSAGVANWLRSYATLRADGFLADDAPADSLVHHVEFALSDGRHLAFTVSELENELAVQYSEEPRAVYRFYSSRKSSLVPDSATIQGGE